MLVNEESIAAALVVLCELSGVTISHLCITRTYIYRTYLIVTICIYKIIIKKIKMIKQYLRQGGTHLTINFFMRASNKRKQCTHKLTNTCAYIHAYKSTI